MIDIHNADLRGSDGLGITMPSPLIGLGQAVAIEALITGLLVLVVFAVAGDPGNSASLKGSAPLAIGENLRFPFIKRSFIKDHQTRIIELAAKSYIWTKDKNY